VIVATLFEDKYRPKVCNIAQVFKQLKQYNLFYAAHLSLLYCDFHHFANESYINNHYSLANITHITGRLPGVINDIGIIKSDSLLSGACHNCAVTDSRLHRRMAYV
jgi:hypothetical protein